MIRTALVAALPLALVACGQSETPPTGNDRQAAAPVNERVARAKIVVDANGLVSKGADPLRFGARRAQVDAFARKAFGAAPETSRNEECGAGPMEFSRYGPLQLAFQDDNFAGWFLRAGEGVVTSDGIAPGTTTLESLKLERQVQQLDTTVEGEFQYTTAGYGTITGFAEPDGTITGLQAGVSCVFP